MEIVLKSHVITCESIPTNEEIMNQIKKLLGEDYYYSHFLLDGKEVYEDPEDYLNNYLGSIARIEIITKTSSELINENLLSANEYLNRAKPLLIILSNNFYQLPTTQHWEQFSDLLEGIQWLNQLVKILDNLDERPQNLDEYLQIIVQLEMEIKNLFEALENKDHVLIADIIQYELIPIFDLLLIEINKTIDSEGCRNNLN